LHVRISPMTAACATIATGAAAIGGATGAAAMGAAATGAAATGAAAIGAGTGTDGLSSGLPHVMQKRMPGALMPPQRVQRVPSTGIADGGIGTPMGGVGGAILGARRAPQSSQKTRWSALAFPHVAQIMVMLRRVAPMGHRSRYAQIRQVLRVACDPTP
jgi:hypothetical protein